ncbi:hypothetical protein BDZ97DRAFT_1912984 [Flammula alnicola]|nr:hypothetical protein BDZ97DRAFT_1912984 [Flammula alnicola]
MDRPNYSLVLQPRTPQKADEHGRVAGCGEVIRLGYGTFSNSKDREQNRGLIVYHAIRIIFDLSSPSSPLCEAGVRLMLMDTRTSSAVQTLQHDDFVYENNKAPVPHVVELGLVDASRRRQTGEEFAAALSVFEKREAYPRPAIVDMARVILVGEQRGIAYSIVRAISAPLAQCDVRVECSRAAHR